MTTTNAREIPLEDEADNDNESNTSFKTLHFRLYLGNSQQIPNCFDRQVPPRGLVGGVLVNTSDSNDGDNSRAMTMEDWQAVCDDFHRLVVEPFDFWHNDWILILYFRKLLTTFALWILGSFLMFLADTVVQRRPARIFLVITSVVVFLLSGWFVVSAAHMAPPNKTRHFGCRPSTRRLERIQAFCQRQATERGLHFRHRIKHVSIELSDRTTVMQEIEFLLLDVSIAAWEQIPPFVTMQPARFSRGRFRRYRRQELAVVSWTTSTRTRDLFLPAQEVDAIARNYETLLKPLERKRNMLDSFYNAFLFTLCFAFWHGYMSTPVAGAMFLSVCWVVFLVHLSTPFCTFFANRHDRATRLRFCREQISLWMTSSDEGTLPWAARLSLDYSKPRCDDGFTFELVDGHRDPGALMEECHFRHARARREKNPIMTPLMEAAFVRLCARFAQHNDAFERVKEYYGGMDQLCFARDAHTGATPLHTLASTTPEAPLSMWQCLIPQSTSNRSQNLLHGSSSVWQVRDKQGRTPLHCWKLREQKEEDETTTRTTANTTNNNGIVNNGNNELLAWLVQEHAVAFTLEHTTSRVTALDVVFERTTSLEEVVTLVLGLCEGRGRTGDIHACV